jgi:tape measure domain-containing protein
MPNYNINITVQGKDNASGMLSGFGASLASIGKIAAGILTSQALVMVFNQMVNLGKVALDSYSSYERLNMSLESLVAREIKNRDGLTSMGQALMYAEPIAKDLLGWVQKLAIKSPFTQQGVADAFQMAMGYGFTADQSKRLTQATVDYVSATGKSPAVMESVARALGQIQAKGKLSGQEVMQLTEAGVNVDQILSKAFGKTTAEIVKMRERGLMPADKAIEAIVTSMEQDFGGAAAKQATSFSGLMSSMSDIKEIGLREFFTGTFETIQPYLSAFVDKFSDPAFLANLREMGNILGGNIRDAIAFLKDDLPKVGEYFKSLITPEMAAAAKGLGESLSGLGASFQASTPAIKTAGAGMWDFLVTSVQAVAPGLTSNVTSIVNSVKGIWEAHGTEIMAIISAAWRVIVVVVTGALSILGGIVDGGMQLVKGIIDGFSLALKGDWAGAWEALKTGALGQLQAVGAGITNFFNLALSLVGTNLTEFKAVWKNNWEMLKTIVVGLWDKIKTGVADWLENMVDTIRKKVTVFSAAGGAIIQGIKQGAQKAWDSFAKWLRGAITDLPEWVKKILKIASPSQVFAGIGYNMMAGMAKGLEAAKNLPYNALAGALGDINVLSGAGNKSSLASSAITNSTVNNNYNLTANYSKTQSEGSLFDNLRMMQMLGKA